MTSIRALRIARSRSWIRLVNEEHFTSRIKCGVVFTLLRRLAAAAISQCVIDRTERVDSLATLAFSA